MEFNLPFYEEKNDFLKSESSSKHGSRNGFRFRLYSRFPTQPDSFIEDGFRDLRSCLVPHVPVPVSPSLSRFCFNTHSGKSANVGCPTVGPLASEK